MKTVFLLGHTAEYVDEDGDKSWDEKNLGIYSTKEKAELAIQSYKSLPGFKDHPDGFVIDEWELDKNINEWAEGFVHDSD